jgi:hypothetical protein
MVPKQFPTMWSMRSAVTAMALLIAAAPCTSIPRVLCTDAGVARSTRLIAPSRAAGTTESPGSAGPQRRAGLRLRGGDSESPVRDRVNVSSTTVDGLLIDPVPPRAVGRGPGP